MIFRSRIGVVSSLCRNTEKATYQKNAGGGGRKSPDLISIFFIFFLGASKPAHRAHEKLVTVECYFKMEKKCFIIYRCKHFLESLDGKKNLHSPIS